jgi:phosphonate transport system permease protein
MPVSTNKESQKMWHLRTRKQSLLIWLGWFSGILLFLIAMRFISDQTLWVFVQDAPAQARDLLSRMFPPRWEYANQLWRPLWDTINMGTLGTILAIVIAVPIAFMAARNTTPHPIFRQIALLIIVFSRSINSLIWALLLVSVIGPGILAGTIAITLRAVGFISKLLYEAIEETNPEAVEAVTSTGAKQAQVISYGIVPQIMPAFVGISVFRWDVNIRESTVVGLVGAGGIGLQLNAAVARFAWADVTVIFLMILLVVLLSEWISAKVRQATI